MFKHTFYAVALMVFVLFLAACDHMPQAKEHAGRTTVTIVHTNDFHSQFDPLQPPEEPSQGGAARLKTVIDGIRAEKGEEHVLLLNGGDNFQGTMFYNTWKGSAEVMLLNHLRFDAITLGNHEFDSGPEELARALAGEPITIAGEKRTTEAAKFLVVASNVDADAVPELARHLVKRAIIHKGGVSYGLVGATTVTTKNVSSPGEHVHFHDYISSVQAQVDRLRDEGIDKIILMSHTSSEIDIANVPQLSGVDVIIAGHDHALFGDPEAIAAMGLPKQARQVKNPYPTVVRDKDGNNVLVVSAYEKGRWVGSIDVTFDAAGQIRDNAWKAEPVFIRGCDGDIRNGNVVDVDCSRQVAAPDARLGKVIDHYRAPMEQVANQLLGSSSVDFVGRHAADAENLHSMGNLIADITLAFTRETDKADAALVNRGGMRADLPKGEIRYKDLNTVLPFDSTISVVELSGEELLETLEMAVSEAGGESYGAYPHVAGMTVAHCAAQPCAGALRKGGLVTTVEVRGKPLALDGRYRIASNDYLVTGGDFYHVFKAACTREGNYCRNTGSIQRDVVANWIRNHSPLLPVSQQRIVIVE